MTSQLAFTFDAKFCSGCKACQAACKDKNDLPVGVLWRRVIEVSGGAWQKNGDAWTNTVFAYNLSMSCNHCVHPKCAGVCPTDAYDVRPDGIVVLDSSKCMGCGYCAWACPYGAPQYNHAAGHMTKCDFCFDQLDQGLPPACVAACPMRVLDYGEVENAGGMALWNVPAEEHPFPMPEFSHTQPHLAIQSHAAMNNPQEKFIGNLEEVRPRIPSPWEEVPLIVFTLLGQLAVGGFWAMTWIFPSLWTWTDRLTPPLGLVPHLIVGLSLGIGLLVSFAHLGTKRNSWRVLAHLRRSWLSKEVLFAGLFGLGWLSTTLISVTRPQVTFEAAALTSILGIGLVYSMSQVYRIPAAPGWNTWRTNASFLVSALLLGVSIMSPVLLYESKLTGIHVSQFRWWVVSGSLLILLLMQLTLMQAHSSDHQYHNLRVGLILCGVMLTVAGILQSADLDWLSPLVFLVVAGEEVLGRWLFYRSRVSIKGTAVLT
jgi:anaerobic dimethyl sulfoxide reductase subunit B (iron-sulfur subunit)